MQNKDQKHIRKGRIVRKCIIAIMTLGVLFGSLKLATRAVFDESSTTTIKANDIEDATLIIGTHLIHLNALNEQLYETALQSASDSAQNQIYYKSELAGGAWVDITDAGSVNAIASDAVPVESGVIENLRVRYHTKSDKITYDLMTGQTVNLFELSNIYNLENMPELEPLKLQYDILKDKSSKTKSDKYNQTLTAKFFQTNVQDEVTEECDAQLKTLQSYYELLAANDADSQEMDMVIKCMEAVDARRRARVYGNVASPYLDDLLQVLQGISSAKDFPKEYQVDSDLAGGASDSVQNLQNGVIEAEGLMLADGTGIISHEQYTEYNNLIAGATANDNRKCETATDHLTYLNNINSSTVLKKEEELNYITGSLEGKADEAFQSALGAGNSAEYKAQSQNANVSRAVLNSLLKKQLSELNAIRLEMQFILEAKIERMEAEDARNFIAQRLDEVPALTARVKADAFQTHANGSIEEYRLWLQESYDNLDKNSTKNQLALLEEQKRKYQQLAQEAYDNNDLAGADKYNELLTQVDSQIDAAGGGVAGAIENAKQNALEAIRNGDTDTARTNLNTINELAGNNPAAAASAAGDIQSAAENQSASMNGAANGSEEPQEGTEEGEETSGGTEEGKETSGGTDVNAMDSLAADAGKIQEENAGSGIGNMNASDALALLEDILGGPFSRLDNKAQAELILAIHKFALFTNRNDMKNQAATLATEAFNGNNTYLYTQYKDGNIEYVSTKLLDSCLGYRYIFNNSEKELTISKKGIYEIYHAFSNIVSYYDGKDRSLKEKEMTKPATFQKVIYLDEGYTQEQYKCYSYYIVNCDYAVLTTEETESAADELYNALVEAMSPAE